MNIEERVLLVQLPTRPGRVTEEEFVSATRLIRWLPGLVLSAAVAVPVVGWAFQAAQAPAGGPPPPSQAQLAIQQASQQDRQKMLDLLHITSLRDGANNRDPQAPNFVNYDEAKANPYPKLPDPLVLKNGKKVTSAKMWWDQRRPEIVEDFDREIYGRMPKVTPKVRWEVTGTTNEKVGDVAAIAKQIVGHVDNSSYPQVTVNIQLALTTPAGATGPVPVIMEFGFVGFGARGGGPAAGRGGPQVPAGPSWQEQVLAKGWGYAILVPGSIPG